MTKERGDDHFVVGFVEPRRYQGERSGTMLFGMEIPVYAETSGRFKVWTDADGGRRGYVTNIAVVPSKQRQGWATSMVRVLFELYPNCVWTVEAPNEESGQLFVTLANRYPDRIRPPLVDASRPLDDPRRYGTDAWW